MKDRSRDLYDEGMKDSLRGKSEQLKGRLKDAGGALTGDEDLQGKGKLDELRGKVRDKIGEIERDLARETDESSQ